MSRTRLPALTPELQVSDLPASLAFYQKTLGFSLLYERPEEGFAAIALGEAALMLEQQHQQADDPWTVMPLDRPLGRGINLQISVDDLEPLYQRLMQSGLALRLPLEEASYRVGTRVLRVRQFMLQDPDGYLLRFSQPITAQCLHPQASFTCPAASSTAAASPPRAMSTGKSLR